jgi:streptomycin 6-kinase
MGSSVPPIPDSLRANLAYGLGQDQSVRWLARAVTRAEELLGAWELVPDQVLAGGSQSLCIKCSGADGATVLKLPASVSSGAAEIAALRAWAGHGAARVLRCDPVDNAMLMNFLGWVGAGSFTTDEVLDLVDLLHAVDVAGSDFGSVEHNLARRVAWAGERFAEPGHELARADLAVAEKTLGDLLSDGARPVLLHGDLQPKNLIVSDDGLVVVDPMPALGPALFDIALWVVKCSRDHPLAECQADVQRLRPALDGEALRRWAWCLAVLESRPYLGRKNRHREDFIERYRDEIA